MPEESDSGGESAVDAPPRAPEASDRSVEMADDAEDSAAAPEVATGTEQPDDASAEAPEPAAEDVDEGQDQAGFDEDRGLPEDEPIPEVFTFPAPQPEEPKSRRRFPVATVAIAAVLFIVLGGALYLARTPIVEALPKVASVYDAVGIQPYTGYGLDIPKEAVKTEVKTGFQGASQAVEISGVVLNTSDRERQVPDLKISFLDAMGKEVQSVITSIESDVIPARQQADFVVLVENMAATATRLSVTFASSSAAGE